MLCPLRTLREEIEKEVGCSFNNVPRQAVDGLVTGVTDLTSRKPIGPKRLVVYLEPNEQLEEFRDVIAGFRGVDRVEEVG